MITGSWVRDRRLTLPRLLPRRLRSVHTLALVLAILLIGWLGWLWYRSSSFVKVERVTVTGLSGPDVPQIRSALTDAAMRMTTLDMQIGKLESAVERYSYVRSLSVSREGAHGVVIHVAEQVPVAVVDIGGNAEIVDAQGELLRGAVAHGALPVVPIGAAPVGTTITARGARDAIAVLAAAPYQLLAHISSATSSSAHGVIVQLRRGPQLYFGQNTQLSRKWDAAVAVLQDSHSSGASYIDVTDPQRPAAGAGVTQKLATQLGLQVQTTTTTTASGASSSGG